MTSVPPRDLLAALEALAGEPRATYPQGSLDHPTTERLVNVLRGKAKPDFGTAEPDTTNYPGLVLTGQQIVGTTRTHVQLYQRYEKLPGFAQYTPGFDSTGAAIHTLRQRVLATTPPVPVNTGLTIGGNATRSVDSTVEQEGYAGTLVTTYKKLDGPEILSREFRVGGESMEVTIRQEVLADTLPENGPGIISDRVEGVNPAESVRTTRILTTANGETVIADDEGYTIQVTDEPTGSDIYITFRIREVGETLPAIDSDFPPGSGLTVFSREQERIEGSARILQVIRTLRLPDTRVENIETSFTFPGIEKHGTLNEPYDWPGRSELPFPGDGISQNTRSLLLPRSKRTIGRLTTTYNRTRTNAIAPAYSVYSPAVLSRKLKTPGETVHGAIRIYETLAEDYHGQRTYLVEDLPASTPAHYSPLQVIRIDLGEEYYKGVYRHRILEVSEETPISQFPRSIVGRTFKSTSAKPILGQPGPAGEKLTVVSDGADVRTVTLYGKIADAQGNPTAGQETVTLTGTAPVRTVNTWLPGFGGHGFKHAHASATSSTRTISIQGTGSLATAGVSASATMAEGDTLVAGRTGSTRTYTARSPGRYQDLVCPAGSAIVATAAASTYLRIVIDSVAHYFWLHVAAGPTTDPAPASSTGHPVEVQTGWTATQIAAALKAAINAVSFFAYATDGTTSDRLNITGTKLGALSFTQDAGNDFTIPAATTGGTTAAANQVRCTYNELGDPLAAGAMLLNLDEAINLTGTEGVTYGPGTTIHADLASDAEDDGTLSLVDKVVYPTSQAWSISRTGTALTVTAFTAGAEGPDIAVIGPNAQDAHDDVDLSNPFLVITGQQGSFGSITVPGIGELEKNLPGALGQITSDSVAVPTNVMAFQFIAAGNPPLAIVVESSPNGSAWTASTAWTPAATFKALGQKVLYQREVTAPAGTAFVRVKITNNGTAARAVSMGVFWYV